MATRRTGPPLHCLPWRRMATRLSFQGLFAESYRTKQSFEQEDRSAEGDGDAEKRADEEILCKAKGFHFRKADDRLSG